MATLEEVKQAILDSAHQKAQSMNGAGECEQWVRAYNMLCDAQRRGTWPTGIESGATLKGK